MAKPENQINPGNWVETHGDYLYNFCITRINNADIARDMVQETFLAALKAQDTFKGNSTERTWLTSILKRKIIDHYRKKSSNKEDTEIYLTIEETGFETLFRKEEPFKGNWNAEDLPKNWFAEDGPDFDSDQFFEILRYCMQKLPEKWAGIFTLKVMDEYESEIVCKEFDISTSNLWVILHRVRLQLRACIEKKWFD